MNHFSPFYRRQSPQQRLSQLEDIRNHGHRPEKVWGNKKFKDKERYFCSAFRTEVRGEEGLLLFFFFLRSLFDRQRNEGVSGNPLSVVKKVQNIKLRAQSPFNPNLGESYIFYFHFTVEHCGVVLWSRKAISLFFFFFFLSF